MNTREHAIIRGRDSGSHARARDDDAPQGRAARGSGWSPTAIDGGVELPRIPLRAQVRGEGRPAAARVEANEGRLSDWLAELFAELGVERAYGVSGGAIVPFVDALGRSPIRVLHCRHETGAGFAALEDSLASGQPAVVFTTTGPGITNALTGLVAARWEGARVVFVSAATPARFRGRGAFQESSSHSLPPSLYSAGPLFQYVENLIEASQLELVAAKLRRGLSRVGGFVAHISVPTDVQQLELARPRHERVAGGVRSMGCDSRSLLAVAERLRKHSTALWVGFGARDAADAIRELAERLGAAVMCSPRGKGVFPETHPQFIGVTGFAGHRHAREWLARHRPEQVLVLGTRLGEFTTFWDPRLVPPRGFIHIDVEPEVTGSAYPAASTLSVQAEIGALVEGLLAELPAQRREMPGRGHSPPPLLRAREQIPVRPQFLMQCVQRCFVDAGALVLTEAGNAFAWGNHFLRFDRSHRYRVSMGFGSMGHAVTGVLGAALADRRRKAVAIAGDGAMLMNSEVSTAVQYGIPAVWVVLNDSRYGMIDHGMRHAGYGPVETNLPFTDFVALARAMGADGVAARDERELASALERAQRATGPFVVDVRIDPEARAPFLERNDVLFGDEGLGAPRS